MKKILMIAVASMSILPAFPASADVAFTGEIGMSTLFTNVDGNKSKFMEYRDTSENTAYTHLWLKYDTDTYFWEIKAADMGYDTQKYELDGGVYGQFKAHIKYSEIPHNYTLGAETFYSGIGTNRLISPGAVPPTSAWTPFDYAIKREAVEVGFSVDRWKPFFFEFSSPNERKTGTYPLGFDTGSHNGPMVEVPQPIDYTTNSINMMAGYGKNPYFGAVSLYYSQFNNDNQTFIVDTAGDPGTQNSYSLPPDNQAYKVAFKGSVRQLPLHSEVFANMGTGRMTSDQSVLTSTTGTPVYGQVFNGRVDTNNVDLILLSNPLSFLHTRIYYKYNQRKNESDVLALTETNTLFGYEKSKAGINLGWDLPAKFKLDTGYSYMSMDRDATDDIPKTYDNTLSSELKYRGFDFMTPKISYEFLQRTGDHNSSPSINDGSGAFVWRYDVAPKIQNTLKASVDIYPTNYLNFTVGYKLIDIDYNDTVLGLKSSRSHQVNLDAGYTLGKMAKFTAYYDLELQNTYQLESTNSLGATPSASGTLWDVTLHDHSYSFGAGSEIYLVPKKFTLLLQYDNVNSNGDADFGLYTGSDPNPDMANWDDYRLSSYSIRLRYSTVTHYTFTLGYAYQSYKYNSAQWDNYPLQEGASSSNLSGAYANPNYNAQLLFVAVDYKF